MWFRILAKRRLQKTPNHALNTASGLSILFALMVIIYPVNTFATNEVKSDVGSICRDFVELLIEDDYRAFIELELVDYSIMRDCRDAHKQNLDNQVYQFGYARVLELGIDYNSPTTVDLDKAVKLLRKSASKGYEPAIFQLFRYHWSQLIYEDPFLVIRYSLNYRINDDPFFYISTLKESKSLRIRNFLLGYLAFESILPNLAVEISRANLKLGSVDTVFFRGLMQLSGLGVDRNIAEGIANIRNAAIEGDINAQVYFFKILFLYIEKNVKNQYYNRILSYNLLVDAVNKGHRFGKLLLNSHLKSLLDNSHDLLKMNLSDFGRFKPEILSIISCKLNDNIKKTIYYFKFIKNCQTK